MGISNSIISILLTMATAGCWRSVPVQQEDGGVEWDGQDDDGETDPATNPKSGSNAEFGKRDTGEDTGNVTTDDRGGVATDETGVSNSPGQPDPCHKGHFDGVALIESQDDVEQYAGYTSLAGLEIKFDEVDLSSLSCLRTIRGQLLVADYEGDELAGLDKLEEVEGGITIVVSESLRALVLPNLVTIGYTLRFSRNEALERIDMPKLEILGRRSDVEDAEYGLIIEDNPKLETISLGNLWDTYGGIFMMDLPSLSTQDFNRACRSFANLSRGSLSPLTSLAMQ